MSKLLLDEDNDVETSHGPARDQAFNRALRVFPPNKTRVLYSTDGAISEIHAACEKADSNVGGN